MQDTLYLEATKDQDMLKVGLYFPDDSMTSYEEIAISLATIEKQFSHMIEKMNKIGKYGNDGKGGLDHLKYLGRMLHDELLTNSVKDFLSTTSAQYLILKLDDHLVHIPWELIYDGHEFLCQRFNMGRQVKTRQQKCGNIERKNKKSKKMWIIANPTNDLQHSRIEGEDIFQYTDQINSEQNTIFSTLDYKINEDRTKLLFKDFDIVHFAGHAEYDQQNPDNSRWKLSKGYLRARDIYKMAKGAPMPSIVFCNACQSAQTNEWDNKDCTSDTSFGLSNAFLYAGVKHYIGPFWKIMDQPSRQFALTFYKHLMSGKTIGESTKLARKILMDNASDICWASYLLYGDPRTHYFEKQKIDHKYLKNHEKEKINHDSDRSLVNQVTKQIVSDNNAKEKPSKKARRSLHVLILIFIVLFICLFYFNLDNRWNINTEDNWTSRPLSIAVVVEDSINQVISQGKDAFIASVIESQLIQYPRISIVDRSRLQFIIKEYQLWKSQWMKSKKAPKPDLHEAKLFLILKVDHTDTQPFVVMHLEDTITGDVIDVFHEPLEYGKLMIDQNKRLSANLIQVLQNKYPLCGKVIEVVNNKAKLNIGYKVGVRNNQVFTLIDKDVKLTIVSVLTDTSFAETEDNVKIQKDWCVKKITEGKQTF